LDGKPMLDHQTAHTTERAFLKRLIEPDASDESRQLQDRLAQAKRDGTCIHRALFLMRMLFLVSLAALGYCAILLPDIFYNSEHFVMRSLGYSVLGSLFAQGVLIGYLLWHRATVSRLRRECRRLVPALAQSQLKPTAAANLIHADPQSSNGFPGSSTQLI
jgi:hypothetical protein